MVKQADGWESGYARDMHKSKADLAHVWVWLTGCSPEEGTLYAELNEACAEGRTTASAVCRTSKCSGWRRGKSQRRKSETI